MSLSKCHFWQYTTMLHLMVTHIRALDHTLITWSTLLTLLPDPWNSRNADDPPDQMTSILIAPKWPRYYYGIPEQSELQVRERASDRQWWQKQSWKMCITGRMTTRTKMQTKIIKLDWQVRRAREKHRRWWTLCGQEEDGDIYPVQAASPAIICWSRNARLSPLWDSCDPWMHFFLAARTRSCWHGSPTCSRGSRRTHLEAASSSLKTEIPPIAPVLLFAFSYQFYCEPHFSSVHVHPPQ